MRFAELHEGDESFGWVALAKGVVWVADEESADWGAVCLCFLQCVFIALDGALGRKLVFAVESSVDAFDAHPCAKV